MTAPFRARRITRTARIQLIAPPSSVFPLFEPLGEKRWAEGWEPEMIYPPSGVTQKGAVFTTNHSEQLPAIWTVTEFDRHALRIEYLRVVAGSHLAAIAVGCVDGHNETTKADVTYTFTALTEPGNRYVDTFTDIYFSEWITSWETAMNYYLRHGSMLPHHAAA
jgi:hypothetical protein